MYEIATALVKNVFPSHGLEPNVGVNLRSADREQTLGAGGVGSDQKALLSKKTQWEEHPRQPASVVMLHEK